MVDHGIGNSSHDLLLALAGRVDDDLLAWCRELVAVGEDDRAVELACATLAADRAPLPAAVRAALVAAARAARTDLDADTALPPAADTGIPHRFDAGLTAVDELAAAVAALPARQVAGCRLHLTARTTPAGAAPGPLPQPVVVAEVGPDDPRPLDVLAYQLAIACARAGVSAAVEVVVAGAVLPAYQRAALLAARTDGGGGPASDPAAPPPGHLRPSTRQAPPTSAGPEPVVPGPEAVVPEPEAAEPEPAEPEHEPEAAVPEPEPAVSERSVSEPSVSEPSVSEPSVSEPSVSEPSMFEPSVFEPSVFEPPVSAPPVSDLAGAPAAGSWPEPAQPEPAGSGPPTASEPATDAPDPVGSEPADDPWGPRSSLADRMAAWDASDRSGSRSGPGPSTGAAPDGAVPAAPVPPAVDQSAVDQSAVDEPAADHPAGRADDPLPAARAVDPPEDDRVDDPLPVGSHPPVDDRPAAVDRAAAGAAPGHEVVRDRDPAPPGRVDAPPEPALFDDQPPADRPEPAPFVRVDSGPVSFEPTSSDPAAPASDDERPRWPATGSLVLPRRRPSPAAAPPEEGSPPEPAGRPTLLRPVPRPAAERGRRRHRLVTPEEEPREATVRPLRPAPPDAPAPASLAEPLTDPLPRAVERPVPDPVIDEDDPLGLGRMPLSRDERRRARGPGADSWRADWLSGEWAIRPPSPVEGSPPPDGPDPVPAPRPPDPADRTGPLLPPETAARLNDDDRDLLARLQAELGGGPRPRATRQAGIAPNGRGPHRPTPPDLAG